MEKRDIVASFLNCLEVHGSRSPRMINGLMDIPYNHVDVVRIGRPIKASHAKTKKYFNRRNKDRPPVNLEDGCAGYFFLEAQSLDVMKRVVIKKVHSKEHLVNYCEEQTRFQYYYTLKNMSFAKRHATKKPVGEKQISFSCHVCDEYFSNEQTLKDHNDTNTHFEMKMVFDRLLEVFIEWYEAKLDPDYSLSSTAVQAEVEGITVKTGKGSSLSPSGVDADEAQIKREREKQREVHRDKAKFQVSHGIFSEIDARRLTLEQFILAAYDKVMEVHWPTPQTKFYCRCCNYEAFETDELLNAHKKTDLHLEHKSKFMEAWCVSCQIHTGNANGYEAHLKTTRHKMIKQLLDDTNKRAVAFWNKVNDMHAAMAGRADQFYDPYMIPAYLPFHGSTTNPFYQATGYMDATNKMENNWINPLKKANLNTKTQNIHNKSHPYYKPKTKVYLADGRRKLSKSKVERDRERMTKFIEKKSASLKTVAEEDESEKDDNSENSENST